MPEEGGNSVLLIKAAVKSFSLSGRVVSVVIVFFVDGLLLVMAVRPCQMFFELLVVRISSSLS